MKLLIYNKTKKEKRGHFFHETQASRTDFIRYHDRLFNF